MLITFVQGTRPPAAVSMQSTANFLDSQGMRPSLDWQQLSAKLDVAQVQLLQARTEMNISMKCKESQQHAQASYQASGSADFSMVVCVG